MLSLPLVALGLATVCAYANPTVRAVGGLEISLSTPTDKVTSVSDLRVVATVKNVGDEDLKILKSGTVLDDELPTRSFIVSKDGKEVPFTGITVCAYPPLSPLPLPQPIGLRLILTVPIGFGTRGWPLLGDHPRRQDGGCRARR